MSSTIAQPSNMKSMNGVVTYDDGAGTVISGGTISTGALNTQNIEAPDPTANSTIYGDSTGNIILGGVNSTVLCPSTPVSPDEVANKAYVDSISGGGVTLSGNNDWTGQNTFDNFAPLCPIAPGADENLANKAYVDSVAGTAGGALLASDNSWAGTNEFDNDVTLGSSSFTNNVVLQGNINIGLNVSSPGPIVTIQGDYQLLRGLAGDIGTYLSSNRTSFGGDSEPAQMVVDISVLDKVTTEYRTNSLNIPQVNSSIVGFGGTSTLGGTLEFNSGNIYVGNSDLSTDVTLRGNILIGDNTASPGPIVTIQGDYQLLRGAAGDIGTYLSSNRTSFGGDSEPAQMVVDISVLDKVTTEYRTNSLNIPQVNSSIVGFGGTSTLGGTLEFNSGNIYVGNSANNTVNYIRGSTNNFQSNDNNFGASGATQSMEMDTSVSGTSSLNFKTNTGNTSQVNSRIVATGGTATNNGTLTTNAGAIISNANSFRVGSASTTGPSVTFDTTTASEIETLFKTNTADPTMNTVRMVASSGTIADRGRFSFFASIVEWIVSTVTFWNTSSNQSLQIDANSTASSVAVNFRTNTASTGTITSSIIGSGGTTAGTGTLTSTCVKNIIKSGTGSTALEITPATDLSTIDFKSSSANNTVTASIVASGGTATALSGTLSVDSSVLNLDSATTNLNGILNIEPTYGIFNDLASGGYYVAYNGVQENVNPATSSSLNFANFIQGFSIIYGYQRTVAATITLNNSTSRDGNYCHIINQSNFDVVISCASARIFGDSVTRGGVTTITLTATQNCKITCYENMTGRLADTALTYGYFVQRMT